MTEQTSLERARALVEQIVQHARAHEYPALMAINADPATEELLAVLPEAELRQARVHLRDARVWRARQSEKAKGKLDAARKALDELDLPLARGILRKIDPVLFDTQELGRYDELLLAVEARAVELEEIQSQAPSPPPVVKQPRRRRFWRR